MYPNSFIHPNSFILGHILALKFWGIHQPIFIPSIGHRLPQPGHVDESTCSGLWVPWWNLLSLAGMVDVLPQCKAGYWNWAVLSDEQMSNGWPCSLLNGEQTSNKVGVDHQPGKLHYNWLYFYELFWKLHSWDQRSHSDCWKMDPPRIESMYGPYWKW